MDSTMFVRELGSGPAVLFLHGTPSPAEDWMPIARRLSDRYRVLVPDLPGYGKSLAPADASYNAVNASVMSMLATRGARSLHAIVGYSTGAYRAFEMLLRGRVEAERVIGISTFLTLDEEGRTMRRRLARSIEADPDFLIGPQMRELIVGMMLSPGWLATHPEDADRVRAWLRLAAPAALAAELDALAASDDIRPELPQLRARTYLRVGALDSSTLPAWSEEIARLAPDASLDIVADRGHALLIEDLEGTAEAIERELARPL